MENPALPEVRSERTAPAAQTRPGLSGKLLLLTVGFVMLAEVLIYLPSIANFRRNWLNDRIAAAQTAALVLEAAPAGTLPQGLRMMLLNQVGAVSVAVRSGGARRLLAMSELPNEDVDDIDLRQLGGFSAVADALSTMLASGPRFLRVVGSGSGRAEFVEIVIEETPLRAAMLAYSGNILLLSLFISGLTAGLLYVALLRIIVAPVRRLTGNIVAFEQNPDLAEGAIVPTGRQDEIGAAEQALQAMQRALARELREKKHLADLGLAVSKINHDLRNMLASAQLVSDRLGSIADPTVQRLAPKLIGALDRAIAFCQSTLAYGRAAERPPQRQALPLAPLVEEMRDLLGLWEGEAVGLINAVPEGLIVEVDPEHLSRILLNLGRNAVQALASAGTDGDPPRLRVDARREPGRVVVEVSDNGPGVPEQARRNLFVAFQGSTRPGGTGLGLAIAAELVRAHQGSISLLPEGPGARFRIVLPDPEHPRPRRG